MIGDGPALSTFGGDIDGLIGFIWWIVFVWFVLAEALIIYFLVRYRRRRGQRAAWQPGTSWRAVAWVLIPSLLVLVFDLWIEVRSARVWDEVIVDIPPHDQLIRVTGRQFVWTFTYAGEDGVLDTDDDFRTVNRMHVPMGRVVRFQLESADVLHSFWIPALRFKRDAVPGRSIPGWFEAGALGRYEIGCAELCGAGHTAMRAELMVEAPEVFDSWARLRAEQRVLAEEAANP